MEGLAAAVAGDVARQRANRLQPFTWQPSVLQLAGECLEAAEVLLNDTGRSSSPSCVPIDGRRSVYCAFCVQRA